MRLEEKKLKNSSRKKSLPRVGQRGDKPNLCQLWEKGTAGSIALLSVVDSTAKRVPEVTPSG